MKFRPSFSTYRVTAFVFFTCVLAACSLEKKSAVNRGLQNLTAHYNILFNANDLLRQKQEIYAASYADNYNQLLKVYQDTIVHQEGAQDKELDAIIARANTIISIKEQSHYIGDAYLLLAKANYFYGRYFLADEFCGYVIRTYPQNLQLMQQTRAWQTRTLLNLHQLVRAKAISDSALFALEGKKKTKHPADIYAARLQYDIDANFYKEGEEMAKLAIKNTGSGNMRRRLIFILAQLQELNKEPAEAYKSYSRIVTSNAAFEMAFNAELNRIRIEDVANGRHISRLDRLRGLLKNENNLDFTDQIYFQIAELYMAEGKTTDAIANYRLAIKKSTRNQNQKGLAYLRLGDISFRNKGDYVGAKKLYDSTLLNLLPNYPGYRAIQLKANNLQTLSEQLQIIAQEDTLQTLAKLNDKDRAARIDQIVKKNVDAQKAAASAATNSAFTNANSPNSTNVTATTPGSGTFYFSNANSVSQGFTDFKRVWGNRKLEDNWRISNRSGSNITANQQNISTQIDPTVTAKKDQRTADDVLANNYRKQLLQAVPVTPDMMAQSNTRVYNAYFTIANFYRDILEDPNEAIVSFEALLKRFPDNTEKAAIYYNLYRLYSSVDIQKSEYYKSLLLKNYPETAFAKVILDPEYGRKLNDQDAEFNAFYNQLYDLYANRQYTEVVTRADQLLVQYPNNKLIAQIAYLRAVAAGHNEQLPALRSDLSNILVKYPDDQLIVPLVNQHLAYIAANETDLAARPVVLVNNDFTDSPFIPARVTQQVFIRQATLNKAPAPMVKPITTNGKIPKASTSVNNTKKDSAVNTAPANGGPGAQATVNVQPVNASVSTSQATTKPAKQAIAPVKAPQSIFSLRDSAHYNFVINVSSGTTNLSSSRFGIGQFNRANYDAAKGISHQLKPVGTDNQLIYVGKFTSLDDVKKYARSIVPLLAQIMKIPADKYSFFIITQENLDKLADKKLLDTYTDFYQKNY